MVGYLADCHGVCAPVFRPLTVTVCVCRCLPAADCHGVCVPLSSGRWLSRCVCAAVFRPLTVTVCAVLCALSSGRWLSRCVCRCPAGGVRDPERAAVPEHHHPAHGHLTAAHRAAQAARDAPAVLARRPRVLPTGHHPGEHADGQQRPTVHSDSGYLVLCSCFFDFPNSNMKNVKVAVSDLHTATLYPCMNCVIYQQCITFEKVRWAMNHSLRNADFAGASD